VYSLNILNTIAKHNIEAIMDVTSKIKALSLGSHWEIKAQCLLFGCNMLRKLRSYSYLLKKSTDETTQGKGAMLNEIKVVQSEKLDRNYAKKLIEDNIEIIINCFNLNAPKCV